MPEPTIWVEIKANIKDFQDKMKMTTKSLEVTKKKYEKLSAGLMSAGRKMAFAGGAITGAMGMATRTFGMFEQSMKNVQAVTGATEEQLKKLSNIATELAPQFGFVGKEAGDAMYYLGSAGMNADEIMEALSGTLALATATQSDLAFATDMVAASLSQFGLDAKDTDRVVNVYTATIANSQATLEKLTESMRYVGPVAKSLGWSIEETSATLGILYNAGLKGGMAGTALRMALAQLLDPTDEVKDTLGTLGIKIEDVNPSMHSMADIIKLIGGAGADTTQIMKIFGIRAGPAMAALIGKGSEAIEGLKAEITGTNKAYQIAEMQLETFQGAMKSLRAEFNKAQIMIGTQLAPIIIKLAGYIKGLAENFNNMAPFLRKVFVIGTALSGVFLLIGGGLLMIASKMIPAIAGLKTLAVTSKVAAVAVKSLSFAFHTLLLPLAAIVGGIWAINKTFDGLNKRREALRKGKAEEKTAEAVENLTKRYRNLKKELDTHNISQKEYEEQSEKIRKGIAYLTGGMEDYNKSVEKRAEAEKVAAAEMVSLIAEKKEAEEEFEKYLQNLRIEYDMVDIQQKKARLEEWKKEEMDAAKEVAITVSGLAEAKLIIEREYQERLGNIKTEAEKEFEKWVKELKEEAVKVEYATKREELEAWHKEALEKAGENQEAISLINQIYATKDAKMRIEKEEEFQKWLANAEIEYGMSGIEAKKARLEEWHEKELAMAGENKEALALIDAEYRERSAELFLEDLQAKAEMVQEHISQVKELFDAYYDYQATKIENQKGQEIDAAQAEYEAEKKRIEAQITDENNMAKELGELEEAYQAQKQNIKEDYAEKEKAMRRAMKPILIAEVIANTAVAITKAYAQLGPILGSIAAGLMATVGALQIAKIQATKYARGGKVRGDEMALVGEEGPEIVRLPAGAEVYTAGETRKMLGYAGGLKMPDFRTPFEEIGGMITAMRPQIVIHTHDPSTWFEEMPADTKSRIWRRGIEEAKEREENL